CSRFTCTSKIEEQLTVIPVCFFIFSASLSLFFLLIFCRLSKKPGSSLNFSSSRKYSGCVIHLSPIAPVIRDANSLLAFNSQRRCVIPFVLLLNFSGLYS